MNEQLINTVKAAFAPGADAATKQQAALILRGLLAVLEPGSAASPTSAPLPTPSAQPPAPDVLTMILDRLRPYLPPEALADMPRFRVPLVTAP